MNIKANVYLGNSTHIVKRVCLINEDGSENEPLPRYVNTGVFHDTVLFGEDPIVRFFTYNDAIEFYGTEPGEYVMINESDRTITLGRRHKVEIRPGERYTAAV